MRLVPFFPFNLVPRRNRTQLFHLSRSRNLSSGVFRIVFTSGSSHPSSSHHRGRGEAQISNHCTSSHDLFAWLGAPGQVNITCPLPTGGTN